MLTGKQLHSELVRTTILKDFAEFEGISKCVFHVWFGSVTSFLMRYRFGNVTNGSALIRNNFVNALLRNNSYPSPMARPGTKAIHYATTCAQLRFFCDSATPN